MKIVALRGKGWTGKSTTLKMFLLCLMKKYDIATKNYETNTDFTAEDLEKEIKNENPTFLSSSAGAQDYIVKFEIDGVKYGITTHGDDEGFLKKGFSFLEDCDIVFCAVRTSGGSYGFLRDQERAQILLVNKTSIGWDKGALKNPLEIINYSNEKQVEILLKIFENI